MAELRIPFIKNDGAIPSTTAIMTRLSTHYRAMLDAGGGHIKIEPPKVLQWPGASSARGANSGMRNPPTNKNSKIGASYCGSAKKPGGASTCPKSHSYYQPVHACCMTCVTNKHVQGCTTTCHDFDESKDLEQINVLLPDSLTTNETSSALLFAIPQQGGGASGRGNNGRRGGRYGRGRA